MWIPSERQRGPSDVAHVKDNDGNSFTPWFLTFLLLTKTKKTNKQKLWISLLKKISLLHRCREEKQTQWNSLWETCWTGISILTINLSRCCSRRKIEKNYELKICVSYIYKLVWDGEMECIPTEYVLYWYRNDWGIPGFFTDLHACC